MKKLIIFSFLFLFLFSYVSADISINPFANRKIHETVLKEDTSNFFKEDFNDKYGSIKLSKTFFWIESDKIAEYSLVENTEQCLINCEARGKAVLYSDGKLFDDLNFINKKGKEEIVNAEYLIKTIEPYEVEVPDTYKEVCDKIALNNTKETLLKENSSCYEVVDTYKNETREREIWVEYKGEDLKAGNYEWKVVGFKSPTQAVDFIPTARGKAMNEWAWWNGDWKFKREIKVKENSGSALSNYSVALNITYDSNMNPDFSDLRFTNSTENGELSYWIESKIDSNWAYIWVKIPTLTASQNTSIYMYYKNIFPVITTSSFNNAFVFADDFESSLNANWLQKRGVWSTTGGYLTKSTTTDDIIVWNASLLNLFNYTVTVNIDNSNGIGWEGVAIRTNNNADYYSIQNEMDTNNIAIEKWLNNAFSSSLVKGTSTTTGNMNITAKAVGTNISFYENGVYKISTTDGALSSGSVGIVNYQNIKGKFYWIKVQPYTSVEPTYTIGEEIIKSIVINLTSPINYYNSSSSTIDFSANLTDEGNLGIQNVSLIINNTIYNTNTSGLTGVYNFSETLSDGFYEWYIEAYDDTDELYESETRYFTIDTTPFIEFVSPTPANASNLSVPYIPVNVTVTEDYFENVTFYFYKGGVLNESITFTDGTRFYNKTGCTCDNWEINATVCTTTGKCNSTETRLLIIDILSPEIEILSPVTSYNYLQPNQTIDLNVSITDASDNLDSCWYKYEEVLLDTDSFETNNDDWVLYNGSTDINRTEDWSSAGDYSVFITSHDTAFPGYFILNKDMDLTNINKIVFDTNIIYDAGLSKFGISLIGNEGYEHPDFDLYSGEEMGETNNIIIDVSSYSGNYTLKFYGDITFSSGGGSYSSFYIDNIRYYGYEPVSFNCSENQTFNYIPDQNTLTVYANDTFGNEGSESVSWDYKLLVLDTVYDEETISTKYNDITLVTKTKGDTTLNTVILKYNNSNVATVETQDGNYSNFTARVHKAVNTEQVFNFSYNVTLQYPSLPSTNFWINHYNQTYVPLFFGRCNATYDTNAVNFTVYEEGTSTELNASHESNLRLWIDGTGSSIYQLAAYQNLAQNESNYDFCISPTDETFYSSGLVSNYRDDADRRDYFLTNFSLNNESQEIPLYLAFTSETDIVTLIVYDSNYNYLEDATIYVQRWIVGTETFENIAILDTDSNGETFINLILYDVYYRFLVYYDGKLVKTTNSERLSSTTKEIPVVLGPDDNYEPFDNIVYDLTFNNATNVVTFSFIDSSGALASGCLKVYNSTIFGEVLLSSECSTSSSATISSSLETNNTYIVRGIITLDDDYDEVSRITQLIITIGDNIPSETMGSYGYMLAILLLGTMFVVGVSLGHPEISFITTGIVMIFVNIMGWLVIPTEVLVLYFSIFLLFLIIGGKK